MCFFRSTKFATVTQKKMMPSQTIYFNYNFINMLPVKTDAGIAGEVVS